MSEMFITDKDFVNYVKGSFEPGEAVNCISVELTIETNKKIHYVLGKIMNRKPE